MLAPRIAVRGIWWRIVRGGGDPMLWTPEAADGRWQAAAVVRGFYLADSEDTAWAEWYRHTAELVLHRPVACLATRGGSAST